MSAEVKMVTSIERLREILPEPGPDSRVRRKELRFIDPHARNFISRSPFVVLSTSSADGRCDATPRGDAPGFVKVLDDTTLIIPDRPGNRRLDSMENILSNPRAGLLFMIPGMDETLRVNGRAAITADPALLEPLAMQGKVPLLGIIVEVEELYFHCARAFRRSRLWEPETWMDRSEMPTLGQIIADQLKLGDEAVPEIDEGLAKANKHLY
ncbi:MAG TPA: pyridoxamine 5'-phosphate oxidase family protein [Thermomicrobiales bacterium]|nr:pyridoxamine 5'-phosphate oxidase family protein [Thermomicrobiales bacterium]